MTHRLEAEGVDYSVFGEIALAAHGFRQFSEKVDVVVTDAGFITVLARLSGNGYSRHGARRLRDDATGVYIRFVIAELSPADLVEIDGRRVMRLEKIIELKLASGLAAAPHRLTDLGDVQKIIEHLHLPLDLAEKLDPSVRHTYIQYWHFNQNATGPDRE